MAKEFEHLLDQYKRLLTKLARDTGGEAYFPKSSEEVVDVCNHIATDIRRQYMLAYTPKNTSRGGYRKIRVQVTGSGQEKTSRSLPKRLSAAYKATIHRALILQECLRCRV